jgi:hypothetical protein
MRIKDDFDASRADSNIQEETPNVALLAQPEDQ